MTLSSCVRTRAPLLLAGHAIIVAVHLDIGAVAKEERGFSTGRHLGTMGASVAGVGLRGGLNFRHRGACRRRRRTAVVFTIAIRHQSHHDEQRNDPCEEARAFITAVGGRSAGRCRRRTADGSTLWTGEVLRPLLSVAVGFNLEGELFSERRAYSVLGKRGDMDKDLLAAQGRRDESEAPVVIPLGERAFDAHTRCPVLFRGDGSSAQHRDAGEHAVQIAVWGQRRRAREKRESKSRSR